MLLARLQEWTTTAASRHLFVGSFGATFVFFNLIYFYLLHLPFDVPAILYLWLIEYFTFGLAYELTESFLETLLPEVVIPSEPRGAPCPAVAILYCVCDDLNPEALENLGKCVYSNLRIFILDDSRRSDSKNIVDSQGITVIRRGDRRGYKAGNLNNWLALYGQLFPYFIVMDSDSILPHEFVKKMISYAEHPSNADTAVFESTIMPWNTTSLFARQQAVLAQCARRTPLRIGNRFGSNFSVGHNNLFRTAAVREIGGFNEAYIAEDFATSIDLLSRQWKCIAVPLESYERAPANLAEYSRRRVRHARQTFQLARMNLKELSWTSRLRLVKSLYFYSQPLVSLLAAVFLMYFNFSHLFSHLRMPVDRQSTYMIRYAELTVFWSVVLVLPSVCLVVRARAQHLAASKCLKAAVLESALFSVTSWAVTCGLVQFWIRGRHRLEFDVTGTAPQPSFGSILKLAGPGLLVYLATLVSVFFNPLLSGLNLAWIVPAVLSPVIIHRYQGARYDRRSKTRFA